MRAVNKGNVPLVNGHPKVVSDYKDWRQDLLERIGNYCCYCNMRLNDSPQVEHVVPKNPQAGHAAGSLLDWDNMLLACGPCNREKSNKPVSNNTHYLPDFHNTQIVFEYFVKPHPSKADRIACIPRPRNDPHVVQSKAQATIDLCKLDKVEFNKRATDLRWKYRYEAWLSAKLWREEWDKWGSKLPISFIPLLVDTIVSRGFFSIWFDRFADVPSVIKEILIGTPGNNLQCFDSNSFSAIPHNLP